MLCCSVRQRDGFGAEGLATDMFSIVCIVSWIAVKGAVFHVVSCLSLTSLEE